MHREKPILNEKVKFIIQRTWNTNVPSNAWQNMKITACKYGRKILINFRI